MSHEYIAKKGMSYSEVSARERMAFCVNSSMVFVVEVACTRQRIVSSRRSAITRAVVLRAESQRGSQRKKG